MPTDISLHLSHFLSLYYDVSEAKGSFAVAASPHGGLVDSSAKPVVASISEPDTADNILLFNRENELAESKKRPLHSNRRDLVTLLEQPLKTVGSQNAKVPVNSAIFLSYARKNRSRPNHGPRGASRDGKGLISETNNQNVHNLSFVSKPKSAHLNDDLVVEDLTSNIQLDNELDHVKPNQTDDGRISGREGKLKITDNRSDRDDKCISPCQDDNAQNSATMASREANAVEVREPAVSDNHEPPPLSDTTKTQNEVCQPDDSGNLKVDRKNILGMKSFYSDSSCTQISSGRDVSNDSDIYINIKNVDTIGSDIKQSAEHEKKLNLTLSVVKEKSKTLMVKECFCLL